MIQASNPIRLAPRHALPPIRRITVFLPQRKRNRRVWPISRLYPVRRLRINGATPSIPLHAFISCIRKVYVFYILYLSPITVITSINNINGLVFIMENVVFSARQKLGFHNFIAGNLCWKALKITVVVLFDGKRVICWLRILTTGRVWHKDLHIGGDCYEWATDTGWWRTSIFGWVSDPASWAMSPSYQTAADTPPPPPPSPLCSSFAIISAYDFVSPLNVSNTPVIWKGPSPSIRQLTLY